MNREVCRIFPNAIHQRSITPLANTLRYLRITGSSLVYNRGAGNNGPLASLTVLEELHLVDCPWISDCRLPQSLRSLLIERCDMCGRPLWWSSPLSSLERLSLREAGSFLLTNSLDSPLLNTSRRLNSLELIWGPDAERSPTLPGIFLVTHLTNLLVQHGPTLKALALDSRFLPKSIIDCILDQCGSLVELRIRVNQIDWLAFDAMIHGIKKGEWGLRKLIIIHWGANHDTIEQNKARIALENLGIEHTILTWRGWREGLNQWPRFEWP